MAGLNWRVLEWVYLKGSLSRRTNKEIKEVIERDKEGKREGRDKEGERGGRDKEGEIRRER